MKSRFPRLNWPWIISVLALVKDTVVSQCHGIYWVALVQAGVNNYYIMSYV